ncbi:MAG: DUF6447 family protein [Pseudomonadales bacterium]|jgi:hypothetical protein|nr:DUF6447 family protein [Pseudomonadales bacterium]
MAMIKIDDKDYDTDKLSDQSKAQLVNLRFVDSELGHLQAQMAVLQTARQVYVRALKEALGEPVL